MYGVFFALLSLLAPPKDLFRGLDLEAALVAAKSEHKCVLALFARVEAPETRKLETTTWNETKVREWLALKAVAVRFDVGRDQELAARLRVHAAPTIVFLGENGVEIDRINGYVDGRGFLSETKSIFGGTGPLERAQKALAAAPGDPHRHLDVAIVHGDRGELAEALTELLWCWDHGVESDPGFVDTRRTFLVRELMRLQRLYPKAGDELVARANALLQRATECAVSDAELEDLLLLDRELQQEERTLAAYDAVPEESEACASLRARLGPHVIDPLIDARRYGEALEWLGDVRARFNESVIAFRREADRLARDDPREAFVLTDTRRRALRNQSTRWYEALLGAARYDEADALAGTILVFDGRGPTYLGLMRAAIRAEAHAHAKALAVRALADPKLTPSEKEDVRTLSAEIIQPK